MKRTKIWKFSLKKVLPGIKEANKVYTRKLKEIKAILDENNKKLKERKQENDLLKTEIDDLNRILSLTEEENKINLNINNNKENTMKSTKNKNNKNNNNNKNNHNNNHNEIEERELESHKEYLSPEYLHDKDKEKGLIPTHTTSDVTRNEILNDLKALNDKEVDDIHEHNQMNKFV